MSAYQKGFKVFGDTTVLELINKHSSLKDRTVLVFGKLSHGKVLDL